MTIIVILTPTHASPAKKLLGFWVPHKVTEGIPSLSLLRSDSKGVLHLLLRLLLLLLLLDVGLVIP